MTRERLAQLSMDELLHLTDIFEVDADEEDEADRETLENMVFDAMEERRRSREDENTFPVSYHQQKFENLDELFGEQVNPDDREFEFPQSYNVNRIELMLRDPSWAFTYWDLGIHDKTEALKDENFLELFLRLESCPPIGPGAAVMEVPVGINDNSWYLNLPGAEAVYRVHLVARFQDHETVLASSQRITVPLGKLSKKLEVLESFETDALIFLSGIEKLDARGVSTDIPQRILKFRETWGE